MIPASADPVEAETHKLKRTSALSTILSHVDEDGFSKLNIEVTIDMQPFTLMNSIKECFDAHKRVAAKQQLLKQVEDITIDKFNEAI